MILRRSLGGGICGGLMVMASGTAMGQTYPYKPIRIVLTEPGGSTDVTARLLAPGLAENLAQQVILDNRGGSVEIPAGIVAKAPADGYTLLLFGTSFWIAPLLQAVHYDPVRDFTSITVAATTPNLVVVHPSLPVKSVKELIDFARSMPGELNYSAAITGSPTHLAGELFKAMARVNIVCIPYKGAGPAVNALIGGQVKLMFSAAGSVAPHVKSGRLKALAVTSAAPSIIAPGLPTVAASGLPGYEMVSTHGIFAPSRTPTAVVDRLNTDIVRVLNTGDMKDKFFNAGLEAVGSSGQHLSGVIKSEMARLGKVIKDAGIRAE